jgi:hypothetical protein
MASLLLLLALLPVQDDMPSGTLTLNGGARATRLASVRAEVKLASPGAGEVRMSLTVGDQAPAWVPFREVSFIDLPGADGEKSVTLRLRDKNGKESSAVTAAIRLDTVPPVLKVEAPERVAGFELPLRLESADAVGMQYTENLGSWSAWEAFTTPKTIALSKGAGAKQVFVRVRDEAGNESVPARLRVEAQDPAAPAAPEGIRSLSLGLRRQEENLELTVWMYGENLRELQAELDGKPVLERMPFVPSWKILVAPAPGPRRLTVKAWDSAGREHQAESVFQEQDLTALPPPEEPTPTWRIDLMGGVLTQGVRFHARTTKGDRDIEEGVMPVVRLQGAVGLYRPLYLQVAGEWAGSQDIKVYSVGADAGVRLDIGRWGDIKFEARFEAGLYFSKLQAGSGFESFRKTVMPRIGAGLGIQLDESLWTELQVDYRIAKYTYTEHIVSGYSAARISGAAVMLGISWRF